MRLSKVGAPDQRLARTIDFDTGTHAGLVLPVTVEYVAPNTLNEEQKTEQRRVLAQRRFVPLEDVEAQNRLLQEIYHRVLAARVVKIQTVGRDGDGRSISAPATIRVLKALVSLDPAAVDAAGGLDAEVPLDTTDGAEIPADKRDAWGCDKMDKTLGDVAKANVLYLVNASVRFRDWLASVVSDISLFQDADWESQRKNS